MQDTLAVLADTLPWWHPLTFSTEVTDWLTAIGTVGAVIVALVLAYRQGAERVRVTCRIGHVRGGTPDGMGGILGDSLEPIIRISAANDGPSAVTINMFSWQIGWIRKVYLPQLSDTAGSTRLPARLEVRGDEAKVLARPRELAAQPDSILAYIRQSERPWLVLRSLKVAALTTTGRSFTGRPHPLVLRMLRTGEVPPDRPA